MNRFHSVKTRLLYKLMQMKKYWKLRRLLMNTSNQMVVFKDKVSEIVWQEKGRDRAANDLLKASVSIVITSLIVVITIVLVENIIREKLNYPVTDNLPRKLLWMRDKYFFCYERLSLSSSYNDFMGVVAGIIALFIGLYYAAISSISGAIYSKTSQHIRDILSHETVGYTYLRSNTQLAMICVGFFIVSILGMGHSIIAIILVGIWASFSFVSFMLLGHRAFNFYDPAKLSGYIIHDVIHNINKCQYRSSTIAGYSREKVNKLSDLLDEIARLAHKDIASNGNSYAEIVKDTCRLISWYQELKRHIPYNSKWYGKKPEHKDWYQAEFQYIAEAKSTSTSLEPELVPDYYWLEDKHEIAVIQGFKNLLENGRFRLALSILSLSDKFIESLMKNDLIDRAMTHHERMLAVFTAFLSNPGSTSINEDIEVVAILEYIIVLKTRIALETIKHCKDHTYRNYDQILRSIDWSKDKSVYSGNFSFRMHNLVNWIRERMIYEQDIEDGIITPTWFLMQLISLEESRYLECIVNTLITQEILRHNQTIKSLSKVNNLQIKACFISEELEYWSKVENALHYLAASWNDFQLNKSIDDLQWPLVDFERVKSEVSSIRKQIILEMADSLPMDHPDSLPDYLGQFLHCLGDDIIQSMLQKDTSRFKAIFRKFFAHSLVKYDQLIAKIQFNTPYATSQYRQYSSIMLELLEISGYAKLLSELYGDSLIWNEVVQVWDSYFTIESNEAPDKLILMLKIAEHPLYFTDRDTIRIQWHNLVSQKLADLPKKKTKSTIRDHPFFGENCEVIHSSKFIRVIASSMGIYYERYDGIDVMLVEYLEPKFENVIERLVNRRQRTASELRNKLQAEEQTDE